MKELIRTNDVVLLSFAESLMKDAGINSLIADQGMSILEGSLGLLPRRFLVPDDDADRRAPHPRRSGVGSGVAGMISGSSAPMRDDRP